MAAYFILRLFDVILYAQLTPLLHSINNNENKTEYTGTIDISLIEKALTIVESDTFIKHNREFKHEVTYWPELLKKAKILFRENRIGELTGDEKEELQQALIILLCMPDYQFYYPLESEFTDSYISLARGDAGLVSFLFCHFFLFIKKISFYDHHGVKYINIYFKERNENE